jgi:hypothetical protein
MDGNAGRGRWASGLSAAPYLWRWLAVTGVISLASAVSYALRLGPAAVKGSPPNGHRPESDPSSSAPGNSTRRAAN